MGSQTFQVTTFKMSIWATEDPRRQEFYCGNLGNYKNAHSSAWFMAVIVDPGTTKMWSGSSFVDFQFGGFFQKLTLP